MAKEFNLVLAFTQMSGTCNQLNSPLAKQAIWNQSIFHICLHEEEDVKTKINCNDVFVIEKWSLKKEEEEESFHLVLETFVHLTPTTI
jgi:hypothetical protein